MNPEAKRIIDVMSPFHQDGCAAWSIQLTEAGGVRCNCGLLDTAQALTNGAVTDQLEIDHGD